ncbi:phospholipase A2 inhibitor beta-like [Eurosta solidaginis]|uniref:phospholipase A2 inhibitor beta-like n=1 Tax=Eurosta solidaginis TaxID=178769 RepID=UPI00353116BF
MSEFIKNILLFLYILTIFWHTNDCEFTADTCRQLNSTENVTCFELYARTTIAFANEEHFKIYVSSDYQTFTITCSGSKDDVLNISYSLPNITLGQLDDIVIDGCIPFEYIFEQLGIIINATLKLQRGVTDTPLERSQLASLTALSSFVLSGFESINEDVLADFENLETLELTRFEAPIPAGLLAPIGENLTKLQMRENRMNMLSAGIFDQLKRLERLDLSFNGLTTLTSSTFKQLYNLTDLDLSNNQITHLPAKAFESLHKLTTLYLSNNRLTQLELSTFATLSKLQHLQIENNALDFVANQACRIFDGLTNLEYLELSNNLLSAFCLPHNMGAVRVNVAHNQISALLVQTGEIQPGQLSSLNVRNNRLQYLNNVALQYLHDSQAELSLAHNPWKCDCESVLWLNFVKLNHKRVADLHELSCAVDGSTMGKVVQLTSNDVCKLSGKEIYYLAAIAAVTLLAVVALIAAFLFWRAAK